MEKIDPYKNKEKYIKWKSKLQAGLPGLSAFNSELLIRYINDMENGLNVAFHNKKGSRSYIRLNALKTRIQFIMREFENRFNLSKIIEVNEQQLHSYFVNLRNGVIRKKDGGQYKSVKDYVKDFKAFWHWWQKTNKKQGIEIPDITVDLDGSGEKPKWVYLTEEEIKLLADSAKYDYRVLIWFLFDSGIRSPTELINIKVSDLYNNFKELNIREEVSKTFGRRIKLMLCTSLLKEYVQKNKLLYEDYLFSINPYVFNKYLKRLAKGLLGEKESPAGSKYTEITMYDLRHCSCCYWLPRYKSESALKYRFGWKKSDKIHYYSELLGMRDTIAEEDLLIDTTKTEIEKRLEKSEKEKELMQEKMKNMELQMARIMEITNKLDSEVKNE